jgi:sodium transport system permease protein
VQLALSFFARGLREAQQYFTPLYLFLVVPAMVAPFLEGWEHAPWTYLIPALNAAFAFRGLLLGTLERSDLALTVLSLAAYATASLAVLVRLLERETVVARS